jgi:beta-N-acetylhexosaminidase
MIFIDIASTALNLEEKSLLVHPLISGLTLFKRNIDSTEQLAELIKAIKAINPLLTIAIDQEGGVVQRLRDGVTAVPAMSSFGKIYDESPEKAINLMTECAWLVGSELNALGIDINFAPVVDIDAGISTVIGNRALHADPDIITILAQTYIDVLTSTGVMPVVKHFPGHGNVLLDSHVAEPFDQRDMDALWDLDMIPYRYLSYPAVMMSHVIYPQIDTLPAGFSPYWLKTLLREQLRFSGIVFSDALDMKAAHVVGSMHDRVLKALSAGCDIALVCNHGDEREALLASLSADPAMKLYKPNFLPGTESKQSLAELQGLKAYQEMRERIEGMLI